jgi:hypothetical protein
MYSAAAFGLAGWLAHLPLREAGTPRRDWHVQVLACLRDDLERPPEFACLRQFPPKSLSAKEKLAGKAAKSL